MTANIDYAPRAVRDLDDAADCIAQDSVDAAVRFMEAAYRDARLLASNPHIGTRRLFSRAALKDIRTWPVSGFRNYLLFYRPTRSGIEIIRVLHGARNLEAILNNDQDRT